jgi:hypothetical protein
MCRARKNKKRRWSRATPRESNFSALFKVVRVAVKAMLCDICGNTSYIVAAGRQKVSPQNTAPREKERAWHVIKFFIASAAKVNVCVPSSPRLHCTEPSLSIKYGHQPTAGHVPLASTVLCFQVSVSVLAN